MDEPLFNELLESVKQADQIMTDHAELRRLAKACDVSRCADEGEERRRLHDFYDCVEPELILDLLDEIDRLKAENEVLRGALKQFAEMLKSINVPIDLDEILKGAKP
ncbi:hypothetical protein [Pseudomonas aeruginosa]|uniref:hypothetical protein n=1 Tax=Pseudomonas aeruginosa TaxID=287 RepID=UPI00227045E5|nr:hypothetical protein [Pseudomonas aeruginosa]MCY0332976.1 hypothetical protein [Pseudomonas aeruginosa]MCY0351074.1 hypothetical protein [Pseudomonas aeruginosa]HDY5291782.1 hypothetical protein [Pseudomonas aeruginosa]